MSDHLYAWEHDGVWHGLRFEEVVPRPSESTSSGRGATTLCGVVPILDTIAKWEGPITCMECLLADIPALDEIRVIMLR